MRNMKNIVSLMVFIGMKNDHKNTNNMGERCQECFSSLPPSAMAQEGICTTTITAQYATSVASIIWAGGSYLSATEKRMRVGCAVVLDVDT